MLYKIIRFYKDDNKKSRVIKTGLYLEEARAHCQDPKTEKKGVYFDGYESYEPKESKRRKK